MLGARSRSRSERRRKKREKRGKKEKTKETKEREMKKTIFERQSPVPRVKFLFSPLSPVITARKKERREREGGSRERQREREREIKEDGGGDNNKLSPFLPFFKFFFFCIMVTILTRGAALSFLIALMQLSSG